MATVHNLLPTYDQAAERNLELGRIADALGASIPISSFADVKRIIRAGAGPKQFPIGSILRTHHTEFGDCDLIVQRHNVDKAADDDTRPTMTLQFVRAIVPAMQFDAVEALYYASSALSAGTYHFTLTNQPWYTSDAGKTFQFTLAQNVPAGGVIVLNITYNQALAGKTANTYPSRASTTAIESATISEGSGGTNLGATDVDLNHIQRLCFGSNNYGESAFRQYLTSFAAAGSVWTPKTKFDRPPNWAATKAGFMAGFDQDFLEAVCPGKVLNYTNSVYESPDSATPKSSRYTTNDKFWLPSRMELYGSSEGVGDGGSQFPLLVGTPNADKIVYNQAGQPVYTWLRSANASYANYVRIVYAGGALSHDTACSSLAAAPVCIIA